MAYEYKVLVTDGHSRKTLAVTRTLGWRGIKVTVGDTTKYSMSHFSKYCWQKIAYPSPIDKPQEWIEAIVAELQNEHYDLIIPMQDETVQLVARHYQLISQHTRIPPPKYDKIVKVSSKSWLLKYATEQNFPCPKTYWIEQLEQVHSLKNELEYPVVIKPQEGRGSRGIVYVKDKDSLISYYEAVHTKYPFPLIQEYIPSGGNACGVSVLLDGNCNLKACFAHRRIREFPVRGGPSTLRESYYHPELADIAIRLLRSLKWSGVAMVEFKEDPRDGIPKLMEINGRFWGSLQLAILSGVDFPYLLYKMCLGENFEPVTTYKIGVKCRWLLPGDLLHFIFNPNRFKMEPSFSNFFDKNTGYDIISSEDFKPVVGRLIQMAMAFVDAKMWKKYIFRS